MSALDKAYAAAIALAATTAAIGENISSSGKRRLCREAQGFRRQMREA